MSEKLVINDRIDLPQGPEQIYALLTDLDGVAPCVPGAVLAPVESGAPDEERSGHIVFGFGPIRYRYQGTVRIKESSTMDRSVVYEAAGTETSGEGTLGVELRMKIEDDPSVAGSALGVSAEVSVTGMVAEMGQGMVQEVAQDIIGQFGRAVSELPVEAATAPGSDRSAAEVPSLARPSQPATRKKAIGGFRLLMRATYRRLKKSLGRLRGSTSKRSIDS